MLLRDLLRLAGVQAELREPGGAARADAANPEIAGLAYDSRRVSAGGLFFCVTGLTSDGHEFAPQARDMGAAALVVERELDLPVAQVLVGDARAAMAPVAAAFWGRPSDGLSVVGVTGTNGKTTTAFLIREILEAAGRRCGLLGTVQQIVAGATEEVERTTPEAIDLQSTLRRMVDGGDVACAMEVSSHALVLGRADAINFDVRVFSNLTQDHLDFHGDMESYYASKRLLFTRPGGASWVNVDDPYGARLVAELHGGDELMTYSAKGSVADLRATDVTYNADGSSFICVGPEGAVPVTTPLPGDFNVENALGALGACLSLGVPLAEAAAALSRTARVPGRFEPIDEGQPFGVLVDYAHTPDSLENVLEAARRLTAEGRVITVFGCGGDRDRAKRPQMGRIGAEGSDLAIVTSDNPRSEDPGAVIAEILAGITDRHGVIVEPDRRAAIATALNAAGAGDLVVIAGKGHEQGQEFEEGRKLPFDDREVAREELQRLHPIGAPK